MDILSRRMSILPNISCWFETKFNCFAYTIYETAKLNLTGLQSNLFKVFIKWSNLQKNQEQLLFSLKLFSIGKIQIGSILLRSLSYFESPSTINILSPLALFQFLVFGTKRVRDDEQKNIWKWIYNKWRTTFPIRMRRVKERLQTKNNDKSAKNNWKWEWHIRIQRSYKHDEIFGIKIDLNWNAVFKQFLSDFLQIL